MSSTEPAVAVDHGNRRLVVTVIAAGLVAAGVALAVGLTLRTTAPSGEQHFLVVESKEDPVPPPVAPSTVASTVEVPSTPADTKKKASTSPKPPRTESDGHDALSAMSRTFSRRQSAIERCFQANALSVTGSPEVSIRFSIDVQGQVTAATVRPGSVAATALGACLEQVARSTTFGPQDKPLTFSIPITARAR
jgi:hypothetical protein